jgi:hypothetical protein
MLQINQKKSLFSAEMSLNHLKIYFDGMKIPAITTPRINDYIESRLNEGQSMQQLTESCRL